MCRLKTRNKVVKVKYALISILFLPFAASNYAASFYGDDKYEIVETPMTWSEADAYAKSKGAILVKIETAEQNTWLKDFLKTVDTTAADGGGAIYSWLGGTDSVTEGAWLWGDGTQVPLNNSGSIWWGNGSGHGAGGSEPDNFDGTQHCLAIGLSGWPSGAPGFYGTAGQWNDINCTNKLTFAIQYPSAKIPQLERDALVELYNSTDGVNWKDNTGWAGEIGTECDWFGVTCSSGVVTRLILNNNSLTGTIPSELGNLTNLTWLQLSRNSLSGGIPSELGNLTKLTWLTLDLNYSLAGSIPREVGNLTNLKLLNLSDNSLSGSIPSELGNLTKLTSIVLQNNSLSGSIPIELGSLTNLTSLYASNNSLSGTIPSELGSLSNLELVYLQNNSLSGSIPTELGGLVKARNLHLSNNSLSGSIPSELGGLTSLEELYLYGNSLSGSIPSELGNLTNLIFLQLDDNSLSGNIPSELGGLANLIGLYLKNNSLSGSIPSELGSLTSIEDLELDFNSLSGSIPSELGGLTSLVVLGLENNSLSGSIPSELGNLTNLTWLTLNNNSLSGSIPAELGNLSNLKYLWLAVNSLTGNIPSELGNLTKLSELTLSNNDLTGAVPASLNGFNIKSSAFKYEPTDEWPSPYNGVTPNASLGLAFNNIGFFRAADATLYVCLRVFTDGLASSVNGVGAFDIGMKIFSLADATIQITKSREFNTGFAFNEKAQLPDCSGKFETTTGVYSDIIQTDTSVLETTWSLVDPVNLILKLESSKDLIAE